MKTVCLEVDLQLDVDHSKVGIYAKGRVLNLAFEDVGGLFTLRRSIRNRVRWWKVGAWFAAHGLTTRFRIDDQFVLECGIPSRDGGWSIGGFSWRFWPVRCISVLWRQR
jgi:hypothetical protein